MLGATGKNWRKNTVSQEEKSTICDRLSANVTGEILIVFIKKIAETKGGSIAMCKMMEDMIKDSAKEKAIEIAIKMLKDNVALKKLPNIAGFLLTKLKKLSLKIIYKTKNTAKSSLKHPRFT